MGDKKKVDLGIAEVLETDVVKDAYSQAGGRELVQEVFGFGQDFVKVLRYLPQMVLFTGDKVKRLAAYVGERVLPENRQLPPARYALPAFENLAVLEEDDPVYTMFAELLAKASDKTQAGSLHPRFAKVLEMLSSQEALLLRHLGEGEEIITLIMNYSSAMAVGPTVAGVPVKLQGTFSGAELIDSVNNLETLALVFFQGPSETYRQLHLTTLGKALYRACQRPSELPRATVASDSEPT